MKKTLIIALLILAFRGNAQTNIFPQLLSCTNSILMTDAQYRCASGSRIFFSNSAGERGFEAALLSSNVIAQLGFSIVSLTANQVRLDKAKAAEKARYQQYTAAQAEAARRTELALEQKNAANAAFLKNYYKQQEKMNEQQYRPYVPATDTGVLMLNHP